MLMIYCGWIDVGLEGSPSSVLRGLERAVKVSPPAYLRSASNMSTTLVAQKTASDVVHEWKRKHR